MAQTFNSKRLANMRKYEKLLTAELAVVARHVGVTVMRHSKGLLPSERIVPNTRKAKSDLSRDIWATVLRPYFIGSGDEPYSYPPPQRGLGIPKAQSSYAQLIFNGIEDGVGVESERQAAIIQKYASQDGVVLRWLTGNQKRVISEIAPEHNTAWYDPFHRFVYQNSSGQDYVLSDAIWETAQTTRRQIDKLLEFHITQGGSAVDIAETLQQYLTTGARAVKTVKPYGVLGSYSARRLARTEITAASGRAYVNAALANPYVDRTKWNLSGSHPQSDICDDNASGGEKGDGVYLNNNIPIYPGHSFGLCYLTAETVDSPASVTRALRAEIDAVQRGEGISDLAAAGIRSQAGDMLQLQGAFNMEFMKNALTYGQWLSSVLGV